MPIRVYNARTIAVKTAAGGSVSLFLVHEARDRDVLDKTETSHATPCTFPRQGVSGNFRRKSSRLTVFRGIYIYIYIYIYTAQQSLHHSAMVEILLGGILFGLNTHSSTALAL